MKNQYIGGRSQVVRQWIVTPSFAGSNPVVRPICSKYFVALAFKRAVAYACNALRYWREFLPIGYCFGVFTCWLLLWSFYLLAVALEQLPIGNSYKVSSVTQNVIGVTNRQQLQSRDLAKQSLFLCAASSMRRQRSQPQPVFTYWLLPIGFYFVAVACWFLPTGKNSRQHMQA